jgi:hypothetical protein
VLDREVRKRPVSYDSASLLPWIGLPLMVVEDVKQCPQPHHLSQSRTLSHECAPTDVKTAGPMMAGAPHPDASDQWDPGRNLCHWITAGGGGIPVQMSTLEMLAVGSFPLVVRPRTKSLTLSAALRNRLWGFRARR